MGLGMGCSGTRTRTGGEGEREGYQLEEGVVGLREKGGGG